jgi:hypothetical protein
LPVYKRKKAREKKKNKNVILSLFIFKSGAFVVLLVLCFVVFMYSSQNETQKMLKNSLCESLCNDLASVLPSRTQLYRQQITAQIMSFRLAYRDLLVRSKIVQRNLIHFDSRNIFSSFLPMKILSIRTILFFLQRFSN